MSTFERNQFKATNLGAITSEQQRAESVVPKPGGSGRPGFITIVEGRNWMRVAPAHSPDEPAYRAKSQVKLNCAVSEIDKDGNETGKVEIKMKNLFIATQHSTSLKQDPVLMYINYVQRMAAEAIQDKEALKKYLLPINGWRSKDGKWNWGIKPSTDYVCYAWDVKQELKRVQLYPDMLNQMKKESVKQNPANAAIVVDIFTDPDQGFPLLIDKMKNEKSGKFDHICSCELPTREEDWKQFFARTRLTDDQLSELLTRESLTELYADVYSRRDFDMAIDGLQRFDQLHNYNVFQNREFLAELEALKAIVPPYVPKRRADDDDDTPAEHESAAPSHETAKTGQGFYQPPIAPAAKIEPLVTAAAGTGAPVPLMKRVLTAYILENYGADFTLPDLSKPDLVTWYNLALQGEELPFDTYAANAVREDHTNVPKTVASVPQSPIVAEAPVANPELADQISKLRSRKTRT